MAPNTSSVFNEAPPQSQQPDAKAGDAGVLVAPPPVAPTPIEPASVPVSAAAASVSGASVSATTSATTTAMSTAAVAAGASPATTASALASALRGDECGAGCFRRRRRQPDADHQHHHQHDRFGDLIGADSAAEDAAALAASERHFQQQLQMSRFARVSPAALDGIKPTLGFRKSCLKRSNSELPADLSALKREAAAAAECAPLVTVPELSTPARPVQKNRRRCWECKVKVGLTAVTCRCDYTFCNKHRYAEEHKCSFDFKVSAKRKLEEENPRVVPSKVARIN